MSTCLLLLYNAAPGNGSHCSPISPIYLSQLCLSHSFSTNFLVVFILRASLQRRAVLLCDIQVGMPEGTQQVSGRAHVALTKPHAVKSTSGSLAPSEGMVRTDKARKGILKFNGKYLVLHNPWAVANQARLPVSLKHCHFDCHPPS